MSIADTARELRGIADRLANHEPVLRVKGADILAYIDDRFAAADSPAGDPWPGLSETTLEVNPRRRGGTPLSDTTRLRRSMAVRTGPRELFFGTNVVYARAQNDGNPNNLMFGGAPAPIPERRFLPVSRDGRTLEPASFWDPIIADIEHYIATGEIR